MASLNPLISFTEPVTRQDLFDMWSNAAFSNISIDDFAEGFMPVIRASSFSNAPSSPQPGQHMWHISENVMYVWHDVIDGTGVSLWLAIGPDKFETAMLTQTCVMPGEAVELIGPDRFCRAYTTSNNDRHVVRPPAGFNQSHIDHPAIPTFDAVEEASTSNGDWTFFVQSGENSGATYYMGETAVTNEWVRVGVDGLVYAGCAAASLPTEALSLWTTSRPVTISLHPDLPAGIMNAASPANPFGNYVGAAAYWNVRAGNLTRSEPWWVSKIAFMPRANINDAFNS